jgi:polyisoprenoid-binding protein YceI
MKKTGLNFILIASIALLQGCSSEPDVENEVAPVEKKACFYSYNSGTANLEWTAYKFTEKTPVKGTFTDIVVEGIETSDDPRAIYESMKFTINTKSVSSNNDERDGKISETFFGTVNTPAITGKVKSLGKDGEAVIEITMNGVTKDVRGEYTLNQAKFAFNTSIDLMNWDMGNGLERLNTLCHDLHIGKDGVSKLWSEIGLSFTSELISDCD